jgi:membrane fusion protein, multidrug efflux system
VHWSSGRSSRQHLGSFVMDERAPKGERRSDDYRVAESDEADADQAQTSDNGQKARSARRSRPFIIALVVLLGIGAVIGTVLWWLQARQFEWTDDAFIDTRIVSISSQINGLIVDVPVNDNQFVDADAVLFRIDERDYRAALDQAKAQVDQAVASIKNLQAQIDAQQPKIDQAEKQVVEAQGALDFSREENTRYQGLLRTGSGSVQRAQQSASDLIQKQASFDGAQANAIAAKKQLEVLKAQQAIAQGQLEQAKASEELADANLSRTVVTASQPGRVTKITAAKGAYTTAGQASMMLVPRDVWITANFKETQLDNMRPGQSVAISIDAYPERTFSGHIDSIQAGSGTAFSLLPAENATGNYVKVVQRVPVKIVFDKLPDVYLGPGMSVVPSVKVR